MKRFIWLFTLLSFFSCGDILQEGVDEIASQTSGMLNFSASFSEENIEGIWENTNGHDYAELYQVYEDSTWLELSTYERITNDKFEDVLDQTSSCELNAFNQDDVDFIETRHYYQFLSNTYQYFANAKISFLDGSSTRCKIKLGSGEFSIIGDYVYLMDIKASLFIEIISLDSLYMGFSE